MSDVTLDDALNKIFPINKGDNFMLGPYHFVCMGWKNGRILATREMLYRGKIVTVEHSLSPDVVLSPGFKTLRAKR